MSTAAMEPSKKPLLVSIRIDRQTQAALDAWRAGQPYPNPTRAEAARLALQDWLTGQGLLKRHDDIKPQD